MKKYVKPTTEAVVYDHDIADAACGVIGNWETSLAAGSEYQLCAHFPVTAKVYTCGQKVKDGHKHSNKCSSTTATFYTNDPSRNSTRKVRVTGHHQIEFMDEFSGVNCSDNIDDGYDHRLATTGCGWKIYDGGNNGTCHFFGRVKVSGAGGKMFEITKTGALPDGCTDW